MLLSRYFVCLALVLPLSAYSQSLKDSVRSFLDTESFCRLDLGLEQISLFIRHRDGIADGIEKRVQELKSVGDSISLIDLMMKKGCLLQLTGSRNEAIVVFEKVLAMLVRHKLEEKTGIIFLRLGQMYEERGRYDLALNAYNRSLNVLEESKDTIRIARLYGNLAILYHHLQDTARTIYFLDKSRQLANGTDKNSLARSFLIEAMVYADLKLIQRSKAALDSVNSLVRTEPAFEMDMLYQLVSARFHRLLGDINGSEPYLENAIRSSRKSHDDYVLAAAILDFASLRLQLGDYKKALILLDESLKLCEKGGFNALRLNAYRSYIQIYKSTKDLSLLAKYQDLYIEQKDKVFSADLVIKIASMQADFATRVDVNLIKDQKEFLELQERALGKKRQINIAIVLGVMLLSVSLWILDRINKGKKAFNRNLDRLVFERTRELEEKQIEIEKSSTQHLVEIKMMQIQMQAQLSTLQGIANLAQKDPSVVDSTQLKEVKDSIHVLKENLKWLEGIRNEREKNEAGQLRK
jgi:tetratricopeptide (TPR) repeat protein